MKILIHNTTKDRNVIVVPTEVTQGHSVKFPPGYSLIDLEIWKDKPRKADDLEKSKYGQETLHEGVEWYAKNRLEAGELVVLEVEEKRDGKVFKRYATTKDFDVRRLEPIIEDTNDSSVLRELREMDSRDEVRALILTRLEKFNKK